MCGSREAENFFLLQYGVLAGGNVCSCGQPLGENWLMDHGSSYRRCNDKTCRRRLFAKADGILEGSHLSLKQWAHLAFWLGLGLGLGLALDEGAPLLT